MDKTESGRLPDGTGLSPSGSSQQAVSPAVAASIPSAIEIEGEIAAAWLKLGRYLLETVAEPSWIEDGRSADTAIEMLTRGERCMMNAAAVIEGWPRFAEAEVNP